MDVLNKMKSALGGGENKGDIVSAVMEMINKFGGLDKLVQKFHEKGLGDMVSSWVGTGNNLPISADQLKSVLGNDMISGLAAKTGMDSGTLTSQLTKVLPDIINKLTPAGKIPEGDLLSQGKSILGGLFKKK